MVNPLKDLRLLVVEDEYLIAEDLSRILRSLGIEVVGPTGKVDRAIALTEQEALDGALLDVKLDGNMSLNLADALCNKGVPLIFITGYDRELLPARFHDAPILEKNPSMTTV